MTPGERRVAATPDSVSRLLAAGYDVVVQSGAGDAAHFADQAYRMVGATVVSSVPASTVDVLLHVTPLHPAVPARMRPGAHTVGMLDPMGNPDVVTALAAANISSFSLDLLPASFIGHAVDALTTQDVASGYRAVAVALNEFDGMVGTTVTAAAVLPAAKVLVVGAGVMGLEAADLFRRLGARVTIADPSPGAARDAAATKAAFVELPQILDAQEAVAQRDQLAPFVADADIVIAALPSHPQDPIALITEGMASGMRPGSVMVDLGTTEQPHIAVSDPTGPVQVELIAGGSVTVLSLLTPAKAVSTASSALFANAVATFLIAHTVEGQFVPDLTTGASAASLLTHKGYVVHPAAVADFAELAAPQDLVESESAQQVDAEIDLRENYDESEETGASAADATIDVTAADAEVDLDGEHSASAAASSGSSAEDLPESGAASDEPTDEQKVSS